MIEKKGPIIADVVFTDNYANEHKVRRVHFSRRGP